MNPPLSRSPPFIDVCNRLTNPDYYYDVIPIHIPGSIYEHFLSQVCTDQGLPEKPISKKAIAELQKLNWTGNIRELRNVIERLVILGGDEISDKDVKAFVAG